MEFAAHSRLLALLKMRLNFGLLGLAPEGEPAFEIGVIMQGFDRRIVGMGAVDGENRKVSTAVLGDFNEAIARTHPKIGPLLSPLA